MKVGFIACHPGSTNALTAVMQELKRLNHAVYCFPLSGYAAEAWETPTIYVNDLDFFESVPTDLDFILYSPAYSGVVDSYIPEFCKENGIQSIAILDIFWLDVENLKKRFPSFPTHLIIPERHVLLSLAETDCTSEVHLLGNPYFDIEKQTQKQITLPPTVAFISNPAEHGLDSLTREENKEIFKYLIDLVEAQLISHLYICLHPREVDAYYTNFLSENISLLDRVSFNPYKRTTECCEHVDVVIGLDSTVLLEEYLRGRAVIFYKNEQETTKWLENPMELYTQKMNIDLPENPLDRIISLLHNLVDYSD